VAAIVLLLRDNLGDWIRHRLRGVEAQSNNAQQVLDECGVALEVLKQQWQHQKESQLSLRARESSKSL